MGSRGRGREDGWEGGVNLVGLESVLGFWWEDAGRRVREGSLVRRRGRRRRRRGIADIVQLGREEGGSAGVVGRRVESGESGKSGESGEWRVEGGVDRSRRILLPSGGRPQKTLALTRSGHKRSLASGSTSVCRISLASFSVFSAPIPPKARFVLMPFAPLPPQRGPYFPVVCTFQTSPPVNRAS